MAKRKPLITRLRSARILLREWRRDVASSEHIDRKPPPDGYSPGMAHELARFDAADSAIAEAIRSMGARP